jgi:hypothetical protein
VPTAAAGEQVYDSIYKKSCANTTSNLHDSAARSSWIRLIAKQSVNKNLISDASRYKHLRKPLVQNFYSFEPILTDLPVSDYSTHF